MSAVSDRITVSQEQVYVRVAGWLPRQCLDRTHKDHLQVSLIKKKTKKKKLNGKKWTKVGVTR